jgi:hypothetical protein
MVQLGEILRQKQNKKKQKEMKTISNSAARSLEKTTLESINIKGRANQSTQNKLESRNELMDCKILESRIIPNRQEKFNNIMVCFQFISVEFERWERIR